MVSWPQGGVQRLASVHGIPSRVAPLWPLHLRAWTLDTGRIGSYDEIGDGAYGGSTMTQEWYLVCLERGGLFRLRATSKDDARQLVTYVYRERVAWVHKDTEQHANMIEDH